MAATATGRVALFSIKPQYADAILSGSKEVEFRRTALAPDVSHVVIYATTPVQRVIGAFEVAGVEEAPPAALWDVYGRVGGIARDDYMGYFRGAQSAYAIRVSRPSRWAQPLSLQDLSPGLRPPQSYQYLREDALNRVWPMLHEPGAGAVARLAGGLLRFVKGVVLPQAARRSGPDGEPVPCQ